MASAVTRSNGTYFDCGYGKPVGVSITCGGSSCPALDTYPNLVCTSNSLTTNCNNQIENCPNNAQPDFVSLFEIIQQDDGSLVENQALMIAGQQYVGNDINGQVSYHPDQTNSPSPPPPPSSSITIGLQGSSAKLSIPPRSHPRLFFGVIMIMSVFVAQIQAHSLQMWGGVSCVFTPTTVVGFPFVWTLLSLGVHTQLVCNPCSCINVRFLPRQLVNLIGCLS
jgi:hypothetical protein